MRYIIPIILLCSNVWAQVSVTPFDPGKSTTTKEGIYTITYSSWAIKSTISGKDLIVARNLKNYQTYTKQIDKNTFDIGLVFKVKPSTNMWEFDIEGSENFDFFYQPALSTGNPCRSDDGHFSCDENVVGSYAVYFKDRMKGKALHIYRPQIIDSKGDKKWCDMFYNDKTNKIEVVGGSKWIETAVYPVTLDPEFGYTGLGASNTNNYGNYIHVITQFTSTESATVQTISIGCYSAAGNKIKACLYYDDGSSNASGLVANTYVAEQTPPTTKGWCTWNVIGATITINQLYWFGYIVNNNEIYTCWDNVPGTHYRIKASTKYDQFPLNPCEDAGILRDDWVVSAYITYTTGGGTTPKTTRKRGGIIGGMNGGL